MHLSKKFLNARTIVLGGLVTVLLTSGIAYAANEWTGANIVNGSLTNADMAAETLTSAKILNGTLTSADIKDGTVTSTDVKNESLTGTDVLDFSLTNADVGVLFAQVNSDGSILNSSGGVTGFSLGTGTYEVNFGRNISTCAFVSTQGEGGIGGAGGAITGVTDRSGNPNAVFATTRDAAGTLVNTAFQIVVVC